MEENPKDLKKEKILTGSIKFLIFAISLTATIFSLFLFWYFGIKQENLNLGRTLAFAAVASVDLVYIFSYKNLKKPIIKMENFFQNKYLFLGVAYGFVLLFLAIYLPFFNKILKTVPLNSFHWLLVFAVAVITTLVVELVKLMKK